MLHDEAKHSLPGKIRVLHLIPKLGHGGAEHQLLHTVRRLNRDRFSSAVCYMRSDAPLLGEFQASGADMFSLAADGPTRWVRWIKGLKGLIEAQRIDVLHATNADAWVLGGIVGKLQRVPVVATLNNSPYDAAWLADNPRMNRFKLWYSRTRTQLALKYGCNAGFVAISQFVKDSHVDWLGIPPDDVRVVYRGVPEEFVLPAPGDSAELREELGVTESFPVLLSVARLVPQKGQRYAIKAMPDIVRDFPKAKLLLVGVGFLETELRELAREVGVAGHVSFLGSRKDIRELHAVSDMFVFPSIYEGFGAALGEALGTGNACIVSATPPLTELVEHGSSGLHVTPRDPAALADAVKKLAFDGELRARLGAGARERAMRCFTIDQSVRGHEDFYEQIYAANS